GRRRTGRPRLPRPPRAAGLGSRTAGRPLRVTDGVSSRDLPTPASALVVVAHPDDAEFQVGATPDKWRRAGTVVHHHVLTDGSKVTWHASADVAALVATRRDEQHAARRELGARGEVVFLGEVDGELGT